MLRTLAINSRSPIPLLLMSGTSEVAGLGTNVAVKLFYNDATSASVTGAVAEAGNGVYWYTPGAGELDTLGAMVIRAAGTGADVYRVEAKIVNYEPTLAMGAGASGGVFDIITKGTTNRNIDIDLYDSATGQLKTGIQYTDVTIKYRRDTEVPQFTLVAPVAGVLPAYVDSSWCEGLLHGIYQFSVPDAALATGANEVTFVITAAGIKDRVVRIKLADSTGGGGSGDTAVDHNTGGTDNLRVVQNGVGVDGVTLRAYLTSDYNAGTYDVQATATTKSDGRWTAPMFLDSGFIYTIVTQATPRNPSGTTTISI